MKKLLGISLVAVLAVAPMMANAAQSVPASNAAALANASTVTGDNTAIATAAYVKGAYDATAANLRLISTDIDVTANGTADNASGKVLLATDSVAENLAHIDAKIGAFQDAESNKIITNTATVSANLKALEGAINTGNSGLSDKIGTIADGTAVIDSNGTLMIDEDDSVAANLGHIDTKIGTMTDVANGIVTNAASVSANLQALEDHIMDAESDIDTLEGTVGTLVDGTYTAGQTIGADLNALDTQVKLNADNIGNVSGLSAANGFDVEAGETLDLVTAVSQAMAEAQAGTAANSIVVYSAWNGGAAPKGAEAVTTMTASEAASAVATANAN